MRPCGADPGCIRGYRGGAIGAEFGVVHARVCRAEAGLTAASRFPSAKPYDERPHGGDQNAVSGLNGSTMST